LVARAAVPAAQVISDDAKVINRDVRELRAVGTFAKRPDLRRSLLQLLVDANVSATIQLDAHFFKANAVGVWEAPRSDEQVAAFDLPLAGGSTHAHPYFFAGWALHVEGPPPR
jgi:hypothetical protein